MPAGTPRGRRPAGRTGTGRAAGAATGARGTGARGRAPRARPRALPRARARAGPRAAARRRGGAAPRGAGPRRAGRRRRRARRTRRRARGQGRGQLVDRPPRGATRECRLALAQERLETDGVNQVRLDVERVSAADGADRGDAAERRPQPGHVRPQGRVGAVRRLAGPQLVDQAISGDGLARREQQQREQRALAPSAEGQRRAVDHDLDRAEDAEVGCESRRLHHLGRLLQFRRDHAPRGRVPQPPFATRAGCDARKRAVPAQRAPPISPGCASDPRPASRCSRSRMT